MDTLTWKKFFDVLAFVVVFVVPVILYLMEKADKSLTWIFIVGWLSIAAAAVYLVLSIPWVWADAPTAVRVWRISFVSALALLVVGYGATKIWPDSPKLTVEHLQSHDLTDTLQKPAERLGTSPGPQPTLPRNVRKAAPTPTTK